VPVFTLDELAAKLEAPDPALLAALMDDESREGYVAVGAEIASSRVLTDVERLYSKAFEFWSHATSAQKDELVGFSPELLAVAVEQARALRDLNDAASRETHTGRGERDQRRSAAVGAFQRALGLRDQLHRVLLGIAGRNARLRKQVNGATGTADRAEDLAQGIEALVALGKKVLGHHGDAVARRAAAARLAEPYLDKVTAAAVLARQTDRDVGGPPPRIGQADLDLADGINLHLLSNVVQAFEAAHDLDSTIPRLVPIATRRLLGRRLRGRQEETGGSSGDAADAVPRPGGGAAGSGGASPPA
jgi:hypothetical protein